MSDRLFFYTTALTAFYSVLCHCMRYDCLLFFNQELLIHYVYVEVTCLHLEYFRGGFVELKEKKEKKTAL